MPESPRLSQSLRARLRSTARAVRGRRDEQPVPSEITLLLESPLFDENWYSVCLGRRLDRRAAVEHYLAKGRENGLTPHPLVVPAYLGEQDEELANHPEDAFLVYLRDRRYELATHPLFDLAEYLASHPRALEHPAGPVGHYLDVGVRRSARVNDWYPPSPAHEPRGLVDWIWDQAVAWSERRQVALPPWGRAPAPARADADTPVAPGPPGLMSVVLVMEHDPEQALRSVRSVLEQSDMDWELLLVTVDDGPEPSSLDLPADDRVHVVPRPMRTAWAARNLGLALARGTYVAWMIEGDTWLSGRLRAIRGGLAGGAVWTHDCARNDAPGAVRRHAARQATRERLEAGLPVELGTVVISRSRCVEAGGFDETIPAGQLEDLLLGLGADESSTFVPRLGVILDLQQRREAAAQAPRLRPWVDHSTLQSTREVVVNRHLPWEALAQRDADEGTVSVVIPTYEDWVMTARAVARIIETREPGTDLEIVVVDNGSSLVPAVALGALPMRFPEVSLVRAAVNHGFALGSNLGLRYSHGSTVVFLNNDTEVQPGWLSPLREALADDDVLGVQPLLVYPEGAIQSAGVVFPRGKGVPHDLLQGFPQEDARGLEKQRFRALTGAALAMRSKDAVQMRGFDPVFTNGMEDIDLCLRLAETRAGHFAVRTDALVVHYESRTPGRFKRSLLNRRIFLDRWWDRLPEDDIAVWAARGYTVHGHTAGVAVTTDRRLYSPAPVLTRNRRAEVREGVPSLRWAIKNPAPYGPTAERWGDTHFARQLASALRSLGQEVVIDFRGEFDRRSGWHDDVVLLLRGLAPYTPARDQVNLLWLISHPEMFARSEPLGWDRVYVASVAHAGRLHREWGVPAVPLLQATDPSLFHPDRARPDTGYPILFVGSSRRVLRPLVGAAVEQQLSLSVIGGDWDDLIPRRYVRAPYVSNADVGASYRAAGVVLNDHWEDMRVEGFLANRLFDAVASGARVVSDDVVGLKEVFGDAIQVVRSPEELAAVVNATDLDKVFGSDEVRRERAARVAQEHSFESRARVLIEDAVRIRAQQGLV